MKKIFLLFAVLLGLASAHPTMMPSEASHQSETDGEKSRKIIGQSVVTSVSVIMNGNEEPQFTDAVGKTVPRPFVPPQVASPINLLNPDRYEFYTFNDKGELVKRLMTLREIQSIVANGNGALINSDNDQNESQSVMLNTMPLSNPNHDSGTKVQDIVDNVQNVLNREMENNKNLSSIPHELLDTPNVSSSWSMILPAIFGNTGDEILPQIPINMTPETEVIDTTTTTRVTTTKRPTTKKPTLTVTKKVPPKVEQKTTQSPSKPSSTSKTQTKRPASSTTRKPPSNTTKKQTTAKLKPKPTSSLFRSTTRRPIVAVINNLPSIKEGGLDETTKTVLITSRPYTTTTTSMESSTSRIPSTTTTKKYVKKPTVTSVKKTSTFPSIIQKVPASSLIKDSQITMIEMKPILAESKTEESKIEKATASSTTSSTSHRPTESVKIETLPPTKLYTKVSSTMGTMSTTESKIPSMLPTVMFSTIQPVSTEKQTTISMLLEPIKLETFATEKITTPETTIMPVKNVETESPSHVEPSSEEIRQDLAISQIIGSLQGDSHFSLNHLYKPFEDDSMKEASTISPNRPEDSTPMSTDKSEESATHMPVKVFIDNQLYLDEMEPILKNIPTTVAPKSQETSTMESEPVYEKITTFTNSKEDSIPLEDNDVMETIEKLLQEQNNSKNKQNQGNLDILGFDDDDETELKFGDTLKNDVKNSEYSTTAKATTAKPSTSAPIVNTKFMEQVTTEIPLTTTEYNEESDTTISTILSEALSNVIEQMIKEQERKKTSSKPTTTVTEAPTFATTEPSLDELNKLLSHYQDRTSSTATTTEKEQPATTTTETIEPSLDELNKLLYHYQELGSKRDELESLSLTQENTLTTTSMPEAEYETTTFMSTAEESHPIIEEKSSFSLHDEKIYSEIDSTTAFPQEMTTTTEDPTAQEFSTFFYVSDDLVEDTTDDLGAFTTEQFVTSEKKISERKNEAFTTAYPLTESDEEEMPTNLVSNVLDAIGLSSEEEEEEEEDVSTEAQLKINPSDSDESDEVTSALSKISSTLDETLQTDIKSDLKLTSNIADSLISVADSLTESFGDIESDENTGNILISTVIPNEQPQSTSTQRATENGSQSEEKNLLTGENEDLIETTSEAYQDTTTEFQQDEMSTTVSDDEEMTTAFSESDTMTTVTYKKPPLTTKKLPKLPMKNSSHKDNDEQLVKDDSSPMIQLSIIRKEDSLEEINIMTPALETSTQIPISLGNFIKIESVSTSSPHQHDTKTNKRHENVRPTVHRSTTTAKSSSLPDIVPSPATKILASNENYDEKTDETVTERVPLIEKAPKDVTDSPLVSMASDENLVQIQVQTKSPPTTVSSTFRTTIDTKPASLISAQNIRNTIKNSQQQFLPSRPLAPTIDLSSNPKENLGLAASTAHLSSDLSDFAKLCNELAFSFWQSITNDGISQSRSVVISPFGLTSTLSMIFLGARGQTSGEMNDLLKLDDTISFNPHIVFRNISESVEQSRNSGIAAAAFARELYSDRTKGKLLPYFKEKAQQFYGAHVEEVNFNVVNDILRRRTNLLVKRHTFNKIKEYLKTNNIWVNDPLAAVSANIFMTDCSGTLNNERDGEMFFQVSPAVRQRRLVPIPAVVFRRGFTAGYDPILDATAVAFGDDLQSTILVMPGQQGSLLPGDNLERLEKAFLDSSNDVWGRLLTTFMERAGLEVQIPRFSHRSLINTTYTLQQMGLKDIFDSEKADLRGLSGVSSSDLYFSDLIQINQFTTCGEDKIGDSHHIEIYPSPALKRGAEHLNEDEQARFEMASVDPSTSMQYKSLFYDPIYDSRYINVPFPLRPRQARLPENPRLRFDRPFLYFVRHNPTGIILFMGRFNPRLLP